MRDECERRVRKYRSESNVESSETSKSRTSKVRVMHTLRLQISGPATGPNRPRVYRATWDINNVAWTNIYTRVCIVVLSLFSNTHTPRQLRVECPGQRLRVHPFLHQINSDDCSCANADHKVCYHVFLQKKKGHESRVVDRILRVARTALARISEKCPDQQTPNVSWQRVSMQCNAMQCKAKWTDKVSVECIHALNRVQESGAGNALLGGHCSQTRNFIVILRIPHATRICERQSSRLVL